MVATADFLSVDLTIQRTPLETALDQPQLYALGLDAIRRLAGLVWTDHNVHDPGVTVLELASYVLTDLAHRATFPVEDLLASDDTEERDAVRKGFSSARQLLTNRALTIRDYRKLLIDLPGIRNAWLYPADVTYFADRPKQRLRISDPGTPGVVPVHVHGVYQVLIDFADDVDLVARTGILRQAGVLLQANRNLCEDFLAPVAVTRQDFRVCGDIELEPGREADVSHIQAQIFFQVEQYLAPDVPNYSLTEMQQARKPGGSSYEIEEIFDGPQLMCGFIKDDEVDHANLPETLKLSDVIRIVTEIPGVLAVRDLLIVPVDSPDVPDKWVVPVSSPQRPQLAREKSRLVYHKDGVPVLPLSAAVDTFYSQLAANATALVETPRPDDLAFSAGRPRHADRYYSFQNHFPATYGIGEAGVNSDAPPRRQAQARQFKAYLLFFDQIMADFCAQLERLRDLFSINPEMEKTYFYQPVDTLLGYEQLYGIDTTPPAGKTLLEVAPGLVQTLVETKADESPEVHDARRHRFLDHLIARYAERFHEYAAIVQAVIGTSSRTLRRHKCRFLEAYPTTGGLRGGAYDYTAQPPVSRWDSLNISGLEQRLCALLDIGNAKRRDFSVTPVDGHAAVMTVDPGDCRFQITNDAGAVLLKAPFGFPTLDDARTAMAHALEACQVPAAYLQQADTFLVVDSAGQTVAQSGSHFADADQLNRAIDDCLDFVRQRYGREALYVIENILLRAASDDLLLPICVDGNCEDCADDDPYSYRIHVILPADAGRFANMEFREYAEGVIRAETPAHILPKVCWIGPEDQQRLEKAYRDWIEAGPGTETNVLATFIEVLYSVKNVYPKTQLASCRNPDKLPKFILGHRALGTQPKD